MDESEVFFRRSGYEYRYRIGMDDDIISLYREQLDRSCACDCRSFILEVRTNFVLKPSPGPGGGEQIIDTERFMNIFPVILDLPPYFDEESMYLALISRRVSDYWLPENEIERVAREAFFFAKRAAADPQNASLAVIPLVVYIDVCTVQLPWESLHATMLRLTKPDRLIPIARKGEESWASLKWMYFRSLPEERVLEDDVAEASARMEACPLCSEAPTYGTLITPLPNCHHVFHTHCIVRCLMDNKSTACPSCCSQINCDF